MLAMLRLQDGKVAGHFVISHSGPVLFPLHPLIADEAAQDVLTQGFPQQIAFFGQGDGFAQAAGQGLDRSISRRA